MIQVFINKYKDLNSKEKLKHAKYFLNIIATYQVSQVDKKFCRLLPPSDLAWEKTLLCAMLFNFRLTYGIDNILVNASPASPGGSGKIRHHS